MRRRRLLVGLLSVLAAVPVVVVLLLVGATVALNAGVGREALLAAINDALAGTAEVGSLDLALPGRIAAGEIRLVDAAGTWGRVADAELVWRPWALLSGRLEVERLTARLVEVDRAPQPPDAPPAAPADDEALAVPAPPELPVSVVVERLAVAEIRVAPALAGTAARLTLDGTARLPAGGGAASLDVTLARLDRPATAVLLAGLDPAGGRLSLSAYLHEPAGGMAARLLGLDGEPEVSLLVEGEGPLDGFAADIAVAAGPGLRMDGRLTLARAADGWNVGLVATSVVSALVPPDLAPLAGATQRLDLAATLGDAGALTLHRLELRAGGTALTAAGRLESDGTLAGEAALSSDLAPASALAGQPLQGTIAVQADLGGRIDAPTAGVRLELAGGSAGGVALERATLTLQAAATRLGADDARASIDGSFDVAGLAVDGLPAELANPAGSFRATAEPATGRVAVERFEVVAGPARLALADARLEPDGSFAGQVRAAVDSLARLPPGLSPAPAGSLAAEIALTGSLAGPTAGGRLTVALRDLATGIPAADRLLGGRVDLTGDVAFDPATGADIRDLKLAAGAVAAGGSVEVGPGFETVDGRIAATVADAARLSDLASVPLDGTIRLTARVGGSLAGPRVDGRLDWTGAAVNGEPLGTVAAEFEVAGLPAAPRGRLEVTAAPRGEAARLALAFAPAAGGIRIEPIALAGAGIDAGGAVTVDPAGPAATGELSIRAPDIAAAAALAGQRAAGSLALDVRLSAPGGRQKVTVEGTLEDVALDGGAVRVADLRLSADLDDVVAAPAGEATLRIGGLAAAGRTVRSLAVDAAVNAAGAGFSVALAGGAGLPVTATARGRIGLGDGTTALELVSAEGQVAGTPFRLAQPMQATLASERTALEGLRLLFGEGRVEADLALTQGRPDGGARVVNFPIGPVLRAAGIGPMPGRIDATLELGGSAAAPKAAARLAVAVDAAEQTGLPPLRLRLTADLRDGRMTAEADLEGVPGGVARVEARAPLGLDLRRFALTDDPMRALDGSIRVDLDLAQVTPYLPPLGELTGDFGLGIDLQARDGVLRGTGEGGLEGGTVELYATGMQIEDLGFRIAARGDSIVLEDLTGRDGEGGSLSGGGRLDLGGSSAGSVDSTVSFDRLKVARLDIAEATTTGEVSLAGPLDALVLAGTVKVDRAEIEIPSDLPGGVVTLDVREINRPGEAAEAAAPPAAAEAPSPPRDGFLELDLTIDMPGQVFVRGRGLETEWGGRLAITGDSAAPRVEGRLDVIEGGIAIAEIDIRIRRGSIEIAPDGHGGTSGVLDVLAEAVAADVTVQIAVTGPFDDPQIALSSTPELPQDEILARLLFGRNVGQLSTLQAIQLGQAALQLSGNLGGGGLVSDVRRSLGLDELSVGTAGGGSAGDVVSGANVSAGRYINDRTYVGVRQGITSDSTSVVLRYRLLDDVSVESSIGAAQGSDIGVTYEKRY